MTREFTLVLTVVNGFLILVGLYFGLPSFRSEIPSQTTEKRSSEQVKVMVDATTDVEKLRAIVISDDATIRADREFASLFRDAAVATSTVAVITGIANILLVNLCVRKMSRRPNAQVTGN